MRPGPVAALVAAAVALASLPVRPAEASGRVVAASLRRGDVLVLTRAHRLLVGLGGGRSVMFPVAVGRRGRAWRGSAVVGMKSVRPAWRPTAAMRRRRHVGAYVAPGRSNPLGVRALYLYRGGRDTLYRIHGTNEPRSIGRSVSSGCIRMLNRDVVAVYRMVPLGARVTVR